jgi:hypothetical protein
MRATFDLMRETLAPAPTHPERQFPEHLSAAYEEMRMKRTK